MSNSRSIPLNEISDTRHLSELTSRCPQEALSAPYRVDPYWGGMWALGGGASWATAKLAARQVQSGLGALPAQYDISEEVALSNLLKPRGFRARLDALGTVDAWRTATAEQLAAITGRTALADPELSGMPNLFAANLIDIGAFSNGLFSTKAAKSAYLYRPAYSTVFQDHLVPRLTYPEWVSVTAGQGWTSGGQYDRHNVLATELGIRVAEYLKVGTVLGEKLSTIDLLAGSGIGMTVAPTTRRADLTVVRKDGLRIAVEITASVSANFETKVLKWAELLASRRMQTSGLTVVFLIADHPEKVKSDAATGSSSTRARAYAAIRKAVAQYPGTPGDRVAGRMGVATWREWFPAKHTASDRFMGLTADFPAGPSESRWQPVSMMDIEELAFEPSDSFDAEAVITNASLLAATPHWLRKPQLAGNLIGDGLARVGLKKVPVPGPARPNRTTGRPLGQGTGVAGDAKPPARLLAG